MSDLINRDELIKELEAHCNNVSGDVDSIIGQTYRMAYQHAIEVVKIYPPAYDVDKVVAELEEKMVCGGLNVLVYNQGLSDAIDIVKRGGVK